MQSFCSEEELVAKLRSLETRRNAFAAVVKEYGEKLYWQIRKMVLSHDDANDLLQNTFLKAWMNLDNFRGDARLSTWLYKIAINECITFLNKQKSANNVSVDDAESVLLQYFDDMKYEDMSEIWGTSVGALKASYHHAVKKIEEFMTKDI